MASVFLVGLLWQAYGPPPERVFAPLAGSERGAFNQEILTAVARDSKAFSDRQEVSVFVTVSGSVNAFTLSWLAEKRRMPLRFSDLLHTADLAEFRDVMGRSAYIVAPARDAPGVFEWLPAAEVRDQVLAELRRPTFTLVRAPSPTLPYFIYRNRRVVEATLRS